MPLLHPQRLVPLGLAALLLSAAAESRAADRPPLRDADYWAIADRVVVALQPAWDARRGAYVSDWQGAAARTNANMLVVHALAARHHHRGPARADERARRLVDHMTHAPMARHGGPAARHRSVCWTAQLDSSKTDHISVDPQIAEALDEAWSARRALGLSPARRAAIRAVARRCARHTQWRFPYVLLNQINWNAQLYAHLAHLTGHHSLLRHDYRRHLMRFIAAFRRPLPGLRTSNLGPGYGFHYSPYRSPSDALNFDTPEYANLVASAFAYYPRARAAGMRALPKRDLRRVRAWLMRLFAGSWTHAGYLNWDTGYGLARWHSGQYWLSAQQALLTLATVPAVRADRRLGRWAKAVFDRGLLLYRRWAEEAASARAPKLPFDVLSEHRDWDLYASRAAANALRAVRLGLGRKRAADPPPLYAFDAGNDRLAVTTPAYSTAIVARNRGAFPYGGIDLARLYAAGQRVAANIGGVPPNAFGAVVTDGAGHTVLASQRPAGARTRLHLVRSAHGARVRPAAYPRVPLAGPFRHVGAEGVVSRRTQAIATTYRFDARRIDAAWRIRCRMHCARRVPAVHFPTWGDARIRVTLRDGTRARPDLTRLGAVARIELGTAAAGYALTLRGPAAAVLRSVPVRPQPTSPHPGPTLEIQLPSRARTGLSARIVPCAPCR